MLLTEVIANLLEPNALVLPHHIHAHLHLELEIIVKLLHIINHEIHQIIESFLKQTCLLHSHVLLIKQLLLRKIHFLLSLRPQLRSQHALYPLNSLTLDRSHVFLGITGNIVNQISNLDGVFAQGVQVY